MTNRNAQAEREGYRAYVETKGNPYRVEIGYSRHTAQWYAWNRGWNRARKEFKKSEFEFLKPVNS